MVAFGVYLLKGSWAYDDPFITYRYASNLIHGFGFVYNPGEQVLSTTTPLFTLLLAGLSLLWDHIPRLANLIGALSIAAGGILLFDLAETLKTPLVGWIGLLFYPLIPLLLDTVGSETPLFLALGLAAFACYFRQDYLWTAICCGLIVLTRPDGMLVPGLLALDFLLRTPRQPIPWKAIAVFLLLILPWYAFAWIYFGSPLPVTLATKQHQALMWISNPFPKGFLVLVKGYLRDWYYWILAGLAFLGLFYFFQRLRQWALFLAWALAHFIAYTVLGVSSYPWYYAHLVPGGVVLVGLGVLAARDSINAAAVRVGALQRFADGLSFYSVLAFSILFASVGFLRLAGQSNKTDPRYSAYLATGLWLRQNTPPGSKVGLLEAGIVGYYSDRPIVDFAGLIQPPTAKFLSHDTTYEDAAFFAIEKYSPQYIVLHDKIYPKLEATYIMKNCQRVKRFSGTKYDYDLNLVVYQCKTAQ